MKDALREIDVVASHALVRWRNDCRRATPTSHPDGPPGLARPATGQKPCATVAASGEFDLANREVLWQALTRAMGARHCIEADFSAVTFIDASAVGVLVHYAQLSARRGLELGVVGAVGQPRLVLAMTIPTILWDEDEDAL